MPRRVNGSRLPASCSSASKPSRRARSESLTNVSTTWVRSCLTSVTVIFMYLPHAATTDSGKATMAAPMVPPITMMNAGSITSLSGVVPSMYAPPSSATRPKIRPGSVVLSMFYSPVLRPVDVCLGRLECWLVLARELNGAERTVGGPSVGNHARHHDVWRLLDDHLPAVCQRQV